MESTGDRDVRTVEVPFEMSAQFLEDYLRPARARLRGLADLSCLDAPEFEEVLGQSEALRTAVFRARRVAPLSMDLLEGESGTGKELFARAIHRASPRRDAPMVAVNCGAIPKTLGESELFGHEPGAHSAATRLRLGKFEAADWSTLFLDEVGELSPEAQVALLCVLQERQVTCLGATRAQGIDVRVIAATNRRLSEEVRRGRFRSDLYCRLARLRLRLPSLRERGDDVVLLTRALLERIRRLLAAGGAVPPLEITPEALRALRRHSWPGNVRELENVLTQAATWAQGGLIDVEDVREALQPEEAEEEGLVRLNGPLGRGLHLEEVLREVKRSYLEKALEEADGVETRAAELLGLTRQTLANWLRECGLKRVRHI